MKKGYKKIKNKITKVRSSKKIRAKSSRVIFIKNTIEKTINNRIEIKSIF